VYLCFTSARMARITSRSCAAFMASRFCTAITGEIVPPASAARIRRFANCVELEQRDDYADTHVQHEPIRHKHLGGDLVAPCVNVHGGGWTSGEAHGGCAVLSLTGSLAQSDRRLSDFDLLLCWNHKAELGPEIERRESLRTMARERGSAYSRNNITMRTSPTERG
jgi:hypothetical protein